MYFLSLGHILTLHLASLAPFFFKCSYQREAYHFNLRITNLKDFCSLYSLNSKDSFNSLHLIKIVLHVKIAIKLYYLNFEIPKIISWMPSSSRSSFVIIKVFMRGWIFNVTRINIITTMVKVSLFGSLHLFNLPSELPLLLLKLNDGPIFPYLKGFVKRNTPRVRSISLTGHDW